MTVGKLKIGIVDYGIGNHNGVKMALQELGHRTIITNEINQLKLCDMLVLPGVGSFPEAMINLTNLNLVEYIKNSANLGLPILGICLGMQLLTTESYEGGHTFGLDLISGAVLPFENSKFHIGWNNVEIFEDDLVKCIESKPLMYFNHSYYCEVDDEHRLGITYFNNEFTSLIKKENIMGVQFHPEKSQIVGKYLLQNLIEKLIHG